MEKLEVIKKRLADIQGNFNPEKNTYKVIDTIINSDLSPNEVLMELSKIKGVNKYPEDLKKEYISIVDDLKEKIIDEKKLEEKKKQEKTTKELKDLIDNLENRKKEAKKLDKITLKEKEETSKSVEEEKLEKTEVINLDEEEKVVKTRSKKASVKEDKRVEKKEMDEETLADRSNKIHVFLLIGIAFVIILTALVVFLY